MHHNNLTCFYCRKFNRSEARCVPGHNAYAKSDSFACGSFNRVPDVRTQPWEQHAELARRKGDLKVL